MKVLQDNHIEDNYVCDVYVDYLKLQLKPHLYEPKCRNSRH